MSLDWNDLIGGGPDGAATTDLVPIGKYDTRVIEAEVAPAGTGKTMIQMVLEIDGGAYNGEWLWNNLVFPDNTSKPGHRCMFMRAMRALGFTPEFLTTNHPSAEQIASLMLGRSVVATVAHREWEKEMRTDVKSLHPPGTSSDEAPPTPELGADTDDELPPPPPIPAAAEDEDVPPPIPVVENSDTTTDNNEEDETQPKAPF